MNEIVECKNIAHFKSQMQKICIQISECRKSSGQSQKEVSEWIGMSLRTYIDLEQGKCTFENLLIVADKFSIDIEINFTEA